MRLIRGCEYWFVGNSKVNNIIVGTSTLIRKSRFTRKYQYLYGNDGHKDIEPYWGEGAAKNAWANWDMVKGGGYKYVKKISWEEARSLLGRFISKREK